MTEDSDSVLYDIFFEVIVVGAPFIGFWHFGVSFEEAAVSLLAVIALGTISEHYP